MKDDELSERDYTWIIITKINQEVTSKLILDMRKNKWSEEFIGQEQLVKVDPALLKKIEEIEAQKSRRSTFLLSSY